MTKCFHFPQQHLKLIIFYRYYENYNIFYILLRKLNRTSMFLLFSYFNFLFLLECKNLCAKHFFFKSITRTKLWCPGASVTPIFDKFICSPFKLLKIKKIRSFKILIHQSNIFLLCFEIIYYGLKNIRLFFKKKNYALKNSYILLSLHYL